MRIAAVLGKARDTSLQNCNWGNLIEVEITCSVLNLIVRGLKLASMGKAWDTILLLQSNSNGWRCNNIYLFVNAWLRYSKLLFLWKYFYFCFYGSMHEQIFCTFVNLISMGTIIVLHVYWLYHAIKLIYNIGTPTLTAAGNMVSQPLFMSRVLIATWDLEITWCNLSYHVITSFSDSQSLPATFHTAYRDEKLETGITTTKRGLIAMRNAWLR